MAMWRVITPLLQKDFQNYLHTEPSKPSVLIIKEERQIIPSSHTFERSHKPEKLLVLLLTSSVLWLSQLHLQDLIVPENFNQPYGFSHILYFSPNTMISLILRPTFFFLKKNFFSQLGMS